MSIYATLWQLQFPRHGYDPDSEGWVEVVAQGVPSHIGSPTPGTGYEDGDPYGAFLPPPVADDPERFGLRAVVFVVAGTAKGTDRSHQEYVDPLLVITGDEYARMPFGSLHERLCDALRGDRSRVIAKVLGSGRTLIVYENGGAREVDQPGLE
jgi:hypothetical protein